ncbi:MAG: DUF4173 domain-containing protein [Clostridiales bacterium]|jgi:hypothetical protein|nr:DUF4173 domain-containing protein [Clostridiales bacterium]
MKNNLIVFGAALALSALYSLCFSGREVHSNLSLLVFIIAAFCAFRAVCAKTGRLADKKAPLLGIPIIIIAAMNAVFGEAPASYFNIIAVNALFALLALRTAGAGVPVSRIQIIPCALWAFFGDWGAAFRAFRRFFSKHGAKKSLRIFLGAAAALPVLIVLTALLQSADAVFSGLVGAFTRRFAEIDAGRAFTVAFFFFYFAAYAFNIDGLKAVSEKTERPAGQTEVNVYSAGTFLGLINALFFFFCVVQTAFLFTGGLFALPGGLVYSQYAREGFFQLLAVTVINFGVISVFLRFFSNCAENRILRGMLRALCVFTVVLIFSSFYRMFMYIDAYGSTPMRMAVLTFLVMELVWIAFTLEKTRGRGDFIKRCLCAGLVFYIILNVTAAPVFSAALNARRFLSGGRLDADYFMYNGAQCLAVLTDIYDAPGFADVEKQAVRERVRDYLRAEGDSNQSPMQRRRKDLALWQNFSVMDKISDGKIRRFAERHGLGIGL